MSALPISDGSGNPDFIDQGLPYDEVAPGQSQLAVDTISAVAYFDQGLPFTANNRLCVSALEVIYWDEDARPFSYGSRLAMAADAVDHYINGIAYTLAGAFCVTAITPNPGVTITQQPLNLSASDEGTAIFTVSAISGNGSPLTYQWQRLNGSWADIPESPPYSGTQTGTLTIDPVALADDGLQFRVEVCNSVDCVISNVVTLTVTDLETFNILTENGDTTVTELNSDNIVSEEAA